MLLIIRSLLTFRYKIAPNKLLNSTILHREKLVHERPRLPVAPPPAVGSLCTETPVGAERRSPAYADIAAAMHACLRASVLGALHALFTAKLKYRG